MESNTYTFSTRILEVNVFSLLIWDFCRYCEDLWRKKHILYNILIKYDISTKLVRLIKTHLMGSGIKFM
jgi:hypothetical protein